MLEEGYDECVKWLGNLIQSAHSYQLKLGKSKPKSKLRKTGDSTRPTASSNSALDVDSSPTPLSEQQLKTLVTSDLIRVT